MRGTVKIAAWGTVIVPTDVNVVVNACSDLNCKLWGYSLFPIERGWSLFLSSGWVMHFFSLSTVGRLVILHRVSPRWIFPFLFFFFFLFSYCNISLSHCHTLLNLCFFWVVNSRNNCQMGWEYVVGIEVSGCMHYMIPHWPINHQHEPTLAVLFLLRAKTICEKLWSTSWWIHQAGLGKFSWHKNLHASTFISMWLRNSGRNLMLQISGLCYSHAGLDMEKSWENQLPEINFFYFIQSTPVL